MTKRENLETIQRPDEEGIIKVGLVCEGERYSHERDMEGEKNANEQREIWRDKGRKVGREK